MKIHNIKKQGESVWYLISHEGIGFVSVLKREDQEEYQISEVSVIPGERRKGIGTTLIKEAEKLIQENGGTEVYLKVENKDVLEWFEKLGYSIIDRYKDYTELMKILEMF